MKLATKNLGELCEFQGGSQPPKSNFIYEPKEGYVRFLQIRDFGSEKNHTYIPISKKNKTCNADDIMIGRYGASVGKILRGKSGAYNVALMKVTPVANLINKEYFWYYLNSSSFQDNLRNVASRSAQDGFSKDDIFNFQVPLPPLPIQQKIVSKLDITISEIDKAIRASEINIHNVEALFQSYLIEVFERGEEGWVSDSIGNLCTLRSGTTVNSMLEKTEGELPYLKVADMNLISNQDSITTSSRFLNISEVNKNSVIRRGSTIFPKRGGAIDTNKKRITDVDIAVDLNIMTVFPSDKLNPYLVYFYFLGLDMRKLGSGSSIRQINNYDIEPLTIRYPKSLEAQKTLINVISNLKIQSETLIYNYKNKKIELSFLKQSILKQAFNGELVKE